MNAPWKSGIGTREPFAAYVCDETTAEAVRPVIAELGWSMILGRRPARCPSFAYLAPKPDRTAFKPFYEQAPERSDDAAQNNPRREFPEERLGELINLGVRHT